MQIGTTTRKVISTGRDKKTLTGAIKKSVQVIYHEYIGKYKGKERFKSITRHELV